MNNGGYCLFVVVVVVTVFVSTHSATSIKKLLVLVGFTLPGFSQLISSVFSGVVYPSLDATVMICVDDFNGAAVGIAGDFTFVSGSGVMPNNGRSGSSIFGVLSCRSIWLVMFCRTPVVKECITTQHRGE